MARKTPLERDLIDYPIALSRLQSRPKKLDLIEEFSVKHASVPRQLLEAYGRSEYQRGVRDGVNDAINGD